MRLISETRARRVYELDDGVTHLEVQQQAHALTFPVLAEVDELLAARVVRAARDYLAEILHGAELTETTIETQPELLTVKDSNGFPLFVVRTVAVTQFYWPKLEELTFKERGPSFGTGWFDEATALDDIVLRGIPGDPANLEPKRVED